MTSRRAFLETSTKTLTGLAFVGCDLLAGHQACAQTRRRETTVGGTAARLLGVTI